ncbi:hypothetical protein NYE91_12635 [Citrobacter freundii]|uniref:hypothetical protein n=1 Tax=Citrobacter freundii TaxID=546 RepID=UPI0015E97508|nr:hypothetical protein [Citrobacter freundii]QLX25504.1 hypothetical protein HV271_12115 [Citrobacter freundii]UVV93666.1 hypothetical protein NYE91_12635 [Citrobacter freundii]
MKAPTYAVIKVNAAGEAEITKQWREECAGATLAGNDSWRKERRGARIGGMLYFRLRCLSNVWWVNPEHSKLNGIAFHIKEIFTCRCCFPEWLFSSDDVAQAEKEIAARKITSHGVFD